MDMGEGVEEGIYEDTQISQKSRGRQRMTIKDDIDVAAVDDIMKKYDQTEKV